MTSKTIFDIWTCIFCKTEAKMHEIWKYNFWMGMTFFFGMMITQLRTDVATVLYLHTIVVC